MPQAAAIASIVGAGVQAGSAINSGVKGSRAGNAAAQAFDRTEGSLNNIMGGLMPAIGGALGAHTQFADPTMPGAGATTNPVGPPGQAAGGKGANATTNGARQLNTPFMNATGAAATTGSGGVPGAPPGSLEAIMGGRPDTSQQATGGKGAAGGATTNPVGPGGQAGGGAPTLSQTILGMATTGSDQLRNNNLGAAGAIAGMNTPSLREVEFNPMEFATTNFERANFGTQNFGTVDAQTTNFGTVGAERANIGQYDIGQAGNTLNQARTGFEQFAANQRATAQEQAALANRASGDSLNRMLADRGISANSGVAGGALSNLLSQQAQGMTELNRNLADMGSQAGLAAAQFDAQNALGLGNLGVQQQLGVNQQNLAQAQGLNQFNLGQQQALNQLGLAQTQGLNQFNLGQQQELNRLGLSQMQGLNQLNLAQLQDLNRLGLQQTQGLNQLGLQQLLGLGQLNLQQAQGLNAQELQNAQFDMGRILAGNDLQNAAVTDPIGLMQGIYQQNYLNPQLTMQSAAMGIMPGLLGSVIGGMTDLAGMRAEGAKQAGAGKGASMGGALGGMQNAANLISGKGGSGSTAPTANPFTGYR